MASEPNNNDELISFIGGAVEGLRGQIAGLERNLGARIDALESTIRGDIEQVHLRLDSIERALSARMGQIETEVSRLRSAVYLLAKDRPEVLRMLGPNE
jgi:hypothetical protein